MYSIFFFNKTSLILISRFEKKKIKKGKNLKHIPRMTWHDNILTTWELRARKNNLGLDW
jgi:hypothetical protein